MSRNVIDKTRVVEMKAFYICTEQRNDNSNTIAYKKYETYTAITGSTSQGSGTSRFMVRVLDNGMLAKNALGPFIV